MSTGDTMRVFLMDNANGFAHALDLPEDRRLYECLMGTRCLTFPVLYLDGYPFRVLSRDLEPGTAPVLREGLGTEGYMSGSRAMIFGRTSLGYPRSLNGFEERALAGNCTLFPVYVRGTADPVLGYMITGFSDRKPVSKEMER